jgi:DNA-binding NarL/FixJ family response regulator
VESRKSVRVLVVDDYEPWLRFVRLTLQIHSELHIIGEASDGLEAVQKAEKLQPDLILLDIGLPKLNGIEAVKQIHEYAPRSKILFLSENRAPSIAAAALRTGAVGYVVKSDAANELLPAIEAVLQDRQFVSACLASHDLSKATDEQAADYPHGQKVATPLCVQSVEIACYHEVGFYSHDRHLLDDVSQFIGAALKAGSATIVIATESHRDSLLPRLQAHGVDVAAVVEEGTYIALDAADTLSTFMVNDVPDPVRFMKAFGTLILTTAKAAKGEHSPRCSFRRMCASAVGTR